MSPRHRRAPDRVLAWIVLAGCCLCAVASFAETVEMKDGRRIVGKVVDLTPESLVLDVGHDRLTLALADIASIQEDPSSRQDLAGLGEGLAKQLGQQAPGLGLESLLAPNQSPPTEQELAALVDSTLPVVEELRGLSAKSAVRKRIVDKEAIQTILNRELAKQYPGETLTKKGKALIKLGLLPASVNLQEEIVKLYTQQTAGMYDPESKVLYLANWIPAAMQAGVVAHELVHALQDQHFDLERYYDQVKGDSESEAARAAVVEGEATAVMMDFQLRGTGMTFASLGDLGSLMEAVLAQMRPHGAATPAYLEAQMMFPYAKGMAFLQAVRQRMPWNDVARLYRDPPRSTEQILHPEKYLDERDDPTPVRLPALGQALGPGWTLVDEDAVGEFGIRTLFKPLLDADAAASVAAGWDGDRYQLYEQAGTGKQVLVWVLVWDSAADAREFAQSYPAVIGRKHPEAHEVSGQPGAWQTSDDEVRLQQNGARVVIREGPRSLPIDQLLHQLE